MIDISGLDYKELKSLETDIQLRMRGMKKARYKELVESAITAVRALVNEGFGSDDAIEVCCEYCDQTNMIDWRSLLDCLCDTRHFTDY